MRIVVAGATGVIGRQLLPRLRIAGREVIGVARNEERAAHLQREGYQAIIADALDADSLRQSVTDAQPEVIINQLTSLPHSLINPVTASRSAKLTNQLRTEASRALADAATAAGARLIAQSIAFVLQPGEGIRTESDPLYLDAPAAHAQVVRAVETLESATTEAGGTVLRYGAFYGPGTYLHHSGAYASMLRRRLLPIIGKGRGVWGMLHLDDAVEATIKAIVAPVGIYNVVDDDRVPASELVPWMADQLGAKPPRRAPRALFSAGPATILRYLFDEQPAVSNQLAKDSLGWTPSHPSWREPLAAFLSE